MTSVRRVFLLVNNVNLFSLLSVEKIIGHKDTVYPGNVTVKKGSYGVSSEVIGKATKPVFPVMHTMIQ